MIKSISMGVIALALSFYAAFTLMGTKAHAQTTTVAPTVAQSQSSSSTVSPTGTQTTTTPSPSVTVPSGAPKTGYEPR